MELSTPLHFTTLNFRDLCPEVCLEMHEEESNLGQVHDSSFLQPHHYQTNIVVQLSCNYHLAVHFQRSLLSVKHGK